MGEQALNRARENEVGDSAGGCVCPQRRAHSRYLAFQLDYVSLVRRVSPASGAGPVCHNFPNGESPGSSWATNGHHPLGYRLVNPNSGRKTEEEELEPKIDISRNHQNFMFLEPQNSELIHCFGDKHCILGLEPLADPLLDIQVEELLATVADLLLTGICLACFCEKGAARLASNMVLPGRHDKNRRVLCHRAKASEQRMPKSVCLVTLEHHHIVTNPRNVHKISQEHTLSDVSLERCPLCFGRGKPPPQGLESLQWCPYLTQTDRDGN
ncbi:hypothetical protein LguiB_005931 [Lonicera macranthoides]